VRVCGAWIGSLAWLLLAVAGARAQGNPPQVSVLVDPCVPVDHGKLEQLLAIELGTSTSQGAMHPAPTRVSVACSIQGIELRLEDALTRKSMTRTLPASSFRDGASSTRLLALAIAEFVVASWIELNVQAPPAVEPLGPPPNAAARRVAERVVAKRAAPPVAPRIDSISAAVAAGVWSSNDGLVLGGGLRLWQVAFAPIAWAAAADVGVTSVDVDSGTIHITTMSLALALAMRVAFGSAAFFSGPGARIGLASVSGDPIDRTKADGKSFTAFIGGPIWLSRLELWAGERVRLGLELELGLSTLPVHATVGNEEVFSLEGVWINSALTVGVGF
jgi:hypothetical protein